MGEDEIMKTYGKSIWDMTAEEIANNGLEDVWVKMIDATAEIMMESAE